MHAWGLRLRTVLRILALAHPPVLPSAMRNDVGPLVTIISQLNTQPTCAPVNASLPALRLATHDSGSGQFATPFLYDSFIHDSTPVYPGALRTLLGAELGNSVADHQLFVGVRYLKVVNPPPGALTRRPYRDVYRAPRKNRFHEPRM